MSEQGCYRCGSPKKWSFEKQRMVCPNCEGTEDEFVQQRLFQEGFGDY